MFTHITLETLLLNNELAKVRFIHILDSCQFDMRPLVPPFIFVNPLGAHG
jgi:hypothetical protein